MIDITPEEARAELERRRSLRAQQNSAPEINITPEEAREELARRKQQKIGKMENITGLTRTPVDTIRDLASGVVGGLGKGGQFIASALTGGYAPTVDFNQIQDVIKSPKQSISGNIVKSASEYLPYGIAGGTSLLGQILASSGFGAATTPENELNFNGLLPNGPLGGAIEGALTPLALAGALKVAPLMNPLRYTSKNIANNIINTEKQLKQKYSNLYDDIWNEAKARGLDNVSISKPDIDIKTIKKYSPVKDTVGIEEFIQDPNLSTAHAAKSDLKGIQRKLEKMTTLRQAERKQYKAVSDAIEAIQNNMFKNAEGKVDPDILNKYTAIQDGYRNEVVPYSTNPNIKAFKRNDLEADELVKALSKGKFIAKRGEYHPELRYRKLLPYLRNGGYMAAGSALATAIMNYLKNKS